MKTKKIYWILSIVSCLLQLYMSASAQPTPIRNNYATEKGLPRLVIERSMIYSPDSNWLYNHHPSIINFKGKLVAIWSNGIKDEDSPGQRVLFSTSEDFTEWSTPHVLAAPLKVRDTLNILTAAGLYQYKDTLVAYYGEYELHRTNTHLWARYSSDAEHWSEPINMNISLVPNHGPEMLKSGRLVISGNITFPYTDKMNGLSGWKMTSFFPDSMYTQDNSSTFYLLSDRSNLPPLCEGSFFQTDDNVLHMLLRVTGKGWKGHLWLTESKDNGTNWSWPTPTAFSDNDSKFHFGRLPDERFYYVGIPDTLHHYDRNPLVISIATDGKYFNKSYIIADQPYQLKKDGLWKGGEYGYPHTMVYKGYLYVVISRKKESIEILRFKISQLK